MVRIGHGSLLRRTTPAPGTISQAVKRSRLLQSDLHADPAGLDVTATERALSRKTLELLPAIGTPSQHRQGLPRHEGVERAKPHRIHLVANRPIRSIFVHILDDRGSPTAQHTVHLV